MHPMSAQGKTDHIWQNLSRTKESTTDLDTNAPGVYPWASAFREARLEYGLERILVCRPRTRKFPSIRRLYRERATQIIQYLLRHTFRLLLASKDVLGNDRFVLRTENALPRIRTPLRKQRLFSLLRLGLRKPSRTVGSVMKGCPQEFPIWVQLNPIWV